MLLQFTSQRMSLDKASMNLNRRQHSLGLAYVTVSRIRKVGGVNILELFYFEHFKHKELDISRDRELDFRVRSN
jgi:hypothetical protein